MLAKIIDRVRRDGLLAVFKKALVLFTHRFIYSRTDILYLSTTTSPALKETELEIHTCDLEEFRQWAQQHERLQKQLALATRRFASGHRCYIGRMPDGRLGHVGWATQGDLLCATYETGDSCKKQLPHTVGMALDFWTPEYARGRNYYAPVMTRIIYDLVQTFGEAWAWVDTRNAPSIAGFRKTEFVPRFVMGRKRYLGGLIERTYEFPVTAY